MREPDPIVYLVKFVEMGIDEYKGLDLKIQRVMSFGEFIHLEERHKTRAGTYGRGGK